MTYPKLERPRDVRCFLVEILEYCKTQREFSVHPESARWEKVVTMANKALGLPTVADLMEFKRQHGMVVCPQEDEWRNQGQRLRAYREAIDFSVRDAAQTLGISVEVLRQMERGEIAPDMTILERLG